MTYIVVPTVGRYDKLAKMIKSVDGYYPIIIMHDINYLGSVYCRNLALRNLDGNIIYATDDIEFTKSSINVAHQDLAQHFPDADGVIGFTQDHQHHPSGVALVGSKFMKRYDGRKLFYPKYHHFAAQEVFDYAHSIKRFYKSQAIIKHSQDFSDDTARRARSHKQADQKLYKTRQLEGKVWPRS